MVDSGTGLDPFTVPLHRPNDRQFPCSEGCTRGMSVVLVKKKTGITNGLRGTQCITAYTESNVCEASLNLLSNQSIKIGEASPWWRHQMETFSASLTLYAGNSPFTGEVPIQGQWRGALMFSLSRAWTNRWANNGDAGDFKRHRTHCDVIVMQTQDLVSHHTGSHQACTVYQSVVAGEVRSLEAPIHHHIRYIRVLWYIINIP